MRISDEHVDTMRAYFTDMDEHDRRLARLQAAGDLVGYTAMMAATVFEMLGRRLPVENRAAHITTWVASTRTRMIRNDDEDLAPDPAAAEALLRTLSGLDSDYAELDPNLQAETQYLLLFALRDDLELDDAALQELLIAARHSAEQVPPEKIPSEKVPPQR